MLHLNDSNPEPPNTLLPLYRGTGFRGGIQGIGAAKPRTRTFSFTILSFFMSKIPRATIDRILEAAKIDEVIGDFPDVDLKKKGVRYLGYCPFHDDRHLGSFVVYPKGNCYKCFSCGAKGGVVDFLMNHEKLSYPDAIRYLGKKYNIETDMTDFNYNPPPPRPAPPPLELLELPKYLMAGTLIDDALSQDNLVTWIRLGICWDNIQRRRVEEMICAYFIGHGKKGHTIFWQVDEQCRVRTGKMMKYKQDGHRDKEAAWNFDFIHATLRRHWDAEKQEMTDDPPYPYPLLFNPDKQEMRQCLFGMNLLDRWKRKDMEQTVCIVESEKTAILMAIAYGNHAGQVWMACGGLENLSREKLQPLIDQRRRIILYPDRDGIEKWQQKAEQLHYDRVTIDTTIVTKWWQPEDGPKADIADVVVRMINNAKPITTIAEVKDTMPKAAPLIDKLNLEIEDDRRTENNG